MRIAIGSDPNAESAKIELIKHIEKTEHGSAVRTEEGMVEVDVHSPVSMNMWGLHPEFFEALEKGFRHIATRYDKLAFTYMGFICLASILVWTLSFASIFFVRGYFYLHLQNH